MSPAAWGTSVAGTDRSAEPSETLELGMDAARATGSGHLLLPHVADVIVSAWAPTVEGCLAEAVHGLVSSFAAIRPARPHDIVAFECDPGPDSELLVELLEEAIYVIDARDEVPIQVAVARTPEGGLVGEFGVGTRSDVVQIGPVPKGIARHGLLMERQGPTWRCQVVVDV